METLNTIKSLLNLCPVPMVIINENDEFLFINESFTQLLGYNIDDLPDMDHWFAIAYRHSDEYRKERERAWKETSKHFQEYIDFKAPGRKANVTCKGGLTCIVEIYGANLGGKYNLVVCVDITEKEKEKREKDAIIDELNEALSELDTLREILPVCSICKKIRDDKDYWEQVNDYISKQSQDDMSHNICPECKKRKLSS